MLASAPAMSGAQAVRRGGGASGFTANTLAANDDESTGSVPIGFTVNFFGTNYSQLFVNNNGNVTFGAPLGEYTPFNLTGSTGVPIVAAFFADVDTRGTGSALTRYGTGTVNGRAAFGVTWDGVGYYDSHVDKLNVFQEILINRFDTGTGNFDIEFDYDQIQWETGDASDGVNGCGGTSAAVGYSAGTGVAGTYAQVNGSFVNGAFLDNPATCSSGSSQVSAQAVRNPLAGQRITLMVRNGQVITATPEPTTIALVGAGVLAVAGVARRKRQG